MLAAFLYAQLESYETIQLKRQIIWEYYHANLKDWAEGNGIRLPYVPDYCQQPYHMYYLLLPSLEIRQGLIEHLKEARILSVFHYLPLHLSDMGRKFGGKIGDCPVTENLSDRLLRLPFYNIYTRDEQERVINAILEYNF
jgi:dTDP-4-amino-4,6-dideoxygalactose transaminase